MPLIACSTDAAAPLPEARLPQLLGDPLRLDRRFPRKQWPEQSDGPGNELPGRETASAAHEPVSVRTINRVCRFSCGSCPCGQPPSTVAPVKGQTFDCHDLHCHLLPNLMESRPTRLSLDGRETEDDNTPGQEIHAESVSWELRSHGTNLASSGQRRGCQSRVSRRDRRDPGGPRPGHQHEAHAGPLAGRPARAHDLVRPPRSGSPLSGRSADNALRPLHFRGHGLPGLLDLLSPAVDRCGRGPRASATR